jgi:hypothetical protein
MHRLHPWEALSKQSQHSSEELLQDYHYVVAFTRFTGQILAEAPVEHLDALLSGLSALSGELRWFRVRNGFPTAKLLCMLQH